jgi:hypothetical protein
VRISGDEGRLPHGRAAGVCERRRGETLRTVEKCANWLELTMARGNHCFNCINREGYPWRAQPSHACKNFIPIRRNHEKVYPDAPVVSPSAADRAAEGYVPGRSVV